MVNSTKCPICGREGIPDYLNDNVTCPGCGSDLKAFRIIDTLEMEAKSKTTVWKPVAIVSAVAALLFALLYFTKASTPTAEKERFSILEDSIAALNERLDEIGKPVLAQNQTAAVAKDTKKNVEAEAGKAETGKVEASQAEDGKAKADEKVEETKPVATDGITAPDNMVTIKNGKKYYTVKKGDSWWKICGKLYNHKVSDTELAKLNGKNKDKPIDVGQEILVK